jgi:hypothetical protein
MNNELIKILNDQINPHGFYLEYKPDDGEGGGNEYEIFSNEHSPGITGVYENIEEAIADCTAIIEGENPL